MRLFKLLSVVFICLALSGCKQPATKLTKYDPTLGKSAAVVIAKVEDADYIKIRKLADQGDDDEYAINHPIISPLPYKYTQSIYTIEPGTYYISYAYRGADLNNPNSRIRYTRLEGITPSNEPVYGSFTVEEGEALYLGDIKINWYTKQPKDMFCMIDNITCVKKDLRKAGYKELSERIEMAKWQH